MKKIKLLIENAKLAIEHDCPTAALLSVVTIVELLAKKIEEIEKGGD